MIFLLLHYYLHPQSQAHFSLHVQFLQLHLQAHFPSHLQSQGHLHVLFFFSVIVLIIISINIRPLILLYFHRICFKNF